jgi:hypothetical protein
MSPTATAITLEALDTGLRQCQPDSKYRVTVGLSGGADTLRAGTSYRSPPDVSGRLGSQPRLRIAQGARRTRELRNAVGTRAHTFGQSQLVVDDPNRIDLRDTRAAPTYSTPAHASLGRTGVPILQLAVVITPKTRMQRSRRDESDGDDRFAAPKLHGPQGVCPSNKRLFVKSTPAPPGYDDPLAPWPRTRMRGPPSARRMSPTTARSKRHSARSASFAS